MGLSSLFAAREEEERSEENEGKAGAEPVRKHGRENLKKRTERGVPIQNINDFPLLI